MKLLSLMDHFQTSDPPWVQLLVLKQGQKNDLEKRLNELSNLFIGVIDCNRCKDHRGLFSEFANVLKFPAYFGNNWAALDECITDLEWLPASGYVLLLKDADQLLVDDSREEYAKFVRAMKKAGEEWSIQQIGEWPRESTPFHVLLTIHDHKKEAREDWMVPSISLDTQ